MLGITSFLLLTSLPFTVQHQTGPDVTPAVQEVFNRILSNQNHRQSNFSYFPLTWQNIEGMYGNNVRLNFHGDVQYSVIRELFRVPDNNMFVPAWITTCLIEAFSLGKAPKPSEQQLRLSLKALSQFYNKNAGHSNSEMTFWPQVFNESAQFYDSSPANLFGVLNIPNYLPDTLIEDILKAIGLDKLEHVFERLVRDGPMFMASFHIPPDMDDTFVNLGLGGLLTVFRQKFVTEQEQWLNQNSNLSSVFSSVSKYAYRPFSNDERVNSIDPRSYFYMRSFLDKAHAAGEDVSLVTTWVSSFVHKPPFSKDGRVNSIDPRSYFYMRSFLDKAHAAEEDVSLVTTWLQDTDKVRTEFDKGVAMPFNVNNVDITVCANFVFGMVMCIGSGVCPEPQAVITDDIQQIFMNTTRLIAYEISTNISSRPDLALTYYPSKFEFYWFVTRSYSWLNRFLVQRKLWHLDGRLREMLMYAYTVLKPALRDHMTNDILSSTRKDEFGYLYIDNFLGDGDVGFDNKTIVRGEDRIFSTSVSVAALINTWTLWSENETLIWEKDAPDVVKESMRQMVNWLLKHSLSDEFTPWCTFFSGSGKGLNSMPFSYPANRREFFNGTTFPEDKFPDTYKNIIAMEGYVSEREYDVMLNKPHFGTMTPMTFGGYNSEPGGFFPFWSSEAYTWATELVALAQYANIQQ